MPTERRRPDLLQELYSTGLLVGMLVDEELAKAGVPQQLFSFLGWVATLQPVTPGTLAAETGLPPTTIRDYVRRLVARGDVRKTPNPADGRSYFLVLTPKGRASPSAAGRRSSPRTSASCGISSGSRQSTSRQLTSCGWRRNGRSPSRIEFERRRNVVARPATV